MSEDLEQYYTPAPLTQVLMDHMPTISGTVLEPTAGNGSIVRALQESPKVKHIITNDIDPQFGCHFNLDATDPRSWHQFGRGIKWTITNPPFSKAHRILELATAFSFNVALLLRVTFLEPTRERGDLLVSLQHALTDILVVGSPRPSFTPDGKTDFATYFWGVWRKPAHRLNCTRVRFVPNWSKK